MTCLFFLQLSSKSHLEMSNRSIVWHQSLTVDLIASPCHVFTPDVGVKSALSLMEQNNWDVAGYSEAGTSNADAIVKRSDLKKSSCSTLQDARESLDIGRLVAEQTPILEALSRIVKNERLYVFGQGGVNRLVTIADLNKQQGKLLVFGIVSALEMRLLDWLRYKNSADEDLSRVLTPENLARAKALLERRKRTSEDTDLLECLLFRDKFTLVLDAQVEQLDVVYNMVEKPKSAFFQIQDIRNNLAHARDASSDTSWGEIARLLNFVTAFIAVPVPND